jgi:hypothetical protein
MKTAEELQNLTITTLRDLITEASALPMPQVATQGAAMEHFEEMARKTAIGAIQLYLSFRIAREFMPNEGS